MLDLNKLCAMDGKVAVITGAASGIGAGITRFFTDAGVTVVMADINEQLARGVEKEILDKGGKAEFIKCNVTREADCAALAAAVAEKYGRIDILVNCAGVARRHTVYPAAEAQREPCHVQRLLASQQPELVGRELRHLADLVPRPGDIPQ